MSKPITVKLTVTGLSTERAQKLVNKLSTALEDMKKLAPQGSYFFTMSGMQTPTHQQAHPAPSDNGGVPAVPTEEEFVQAMLNMAAIIRRM